MVLKCKVVYWDGLEVREAHPLTIRTQGNHRPLGHPPLTNITEDKQGFLGGVVEVSQGGASHTSRENNGKAIEIKTKLKRN